MALVPEDEAVYERMTARAFIELAAKLSGLDDVPGRARDVLETVDLDFTEVDRPAFPYPVQVVQFGNDLTLIALASEVVVDYSLRLKLELTRANGPAVWVAGYSNVYAGYIPSRRVLVEGGYEAASRPWDVSLEERIVSKVHELVGRLTPPSSESPR